MIVIVETGTGNFGSIKNMLKKVKAQSVISSDPSVILAAEKLILPGVGAFGHGMNNLSQKGLIPVLEEKVIEKRTPILGICLGMQLMAKTSDEGGAAGLNWIDAEVQRFNFNSQHEKLKIPHMRWNTISVCKEHALFREMDELSRFYFVHSYYVKCNNDDNVLATTSYGGEFASAIGNGNIAGVQFHPEKSHKFGMNLLRNFVEW